MAAVNNSLELNNEFEWNNPLPDSSRQSDYKKQNDKHEIPKNSNEKQPLSSTNLFLVPPN